MKTVELHLHQRETRCQQKRSIIHRYRVNPSELVPLIRYRDSRKRLEDWIYADNILELVWYREEEQRVVFSPGWHLERMREHALGEVIPAIYAFVANAAFVVPTSLTTCQILQTPLSFVAFHNLDVKKWDSL